jgi:hypothetical protein
MLISAWDVVKRVPITWELTSLKVGERRGLLRMLLRLPEKAVLALDRGYPGREVLGEIVASGRDFVVRMVSAKAGSWNVVADFIASGKRSAIVEITLGKGKKKRLFRLLCGLTSGKQRFDESDRAPIRRSRTGWPS